MIDQPDRLLASFHLGERRGLARTDNGDAYLDSEPAAQERAEIFFEVFALRCARLDDHCHLVAGADARHLADVFSGGVFPLVEQGADGGGVDVDPA